MIQEKNRKLVDDLQQILIESIPVTADYIIDREVGSAKHRQTGLLSITLEMEDFDSATKLLDAGFRPADQWNISQNARDFLKSYFEQRTLIKKCQPCNQSQNLIADISL